MPHAPLAVLRALPALPSLSLAVLAWSRMAWCLALVGVCSSLGCAGPGAAPAPPRAGPPAPSARPAPAAAVEPAPATFGVASDCEAAARAAAAILERGGSAADAAIAGMLVAGVVEPQSSGLGGGGLALVHDAAGVVVIDFRPRAPARVAPRAVDRARLALDEEGRAALVAVPGELAGLAALHRRAGRLPFGSLFEPALAAAREGFVASPRLAAAAAETADWLAASALGPALAPGGRPVAAGARVGPRPALLSLLEALAAGGEAAFYGGPVAEALAGGALGADDLAGYRAEERAPVATALGAVEVLSPPSHGGLVLAETLRLIDPAARGPAGLDALARAISAARRDVLRHGHELEVDALLVPDRIDRLRRSGAGASARLPGGTTSLVVVSGDEVVAISSTLGEPFGAKIVRAGVVLNGQLAAFARPHEVRRFGAPVVSPGAPAPTSLAPTLVLREGQIAFAIAASGGEHIPGAIAQVILALAVGDRPAAAIAAPRIRVPAAGGLWLEPGADEALATALRGFGHHVRSDLPAGDAVQLVTRPPDLEAIVDPRKGGAAAVGR